ncbi:hypothetical protein EST38_g2249 [Candolleomyces aberdarensis]|uniref:NmrA-like domain-containing protein n=1 Tax=Candolleomyces aberdarensis TaxID=2316362 RepID=A0A4Q2DWE9_9AGAR|nr:hypothetical protein EST38_g2249 [Candolleomyces aberdarensis]
MTLRATLGRHGNGLGVAHLWAVFELGSSIKRPGKLSEKKRWAYPGKKPKTILIVGVTGAQEMAVATALLRPSPEAGTPSPYHVRALTRDPTSRRARELEAMGAELFQGSFYDMNAKQLFMSGCYGAFINTETYTVGEEREIWAAIKLYEIARRTPSMRHWIWSNLDYGSKLGNYDPQYKTEHHDAKGIANDWLKSQPSFLGDKLTWTSLTSSVYMEMQNSPLCDPLNIRPDGTHIFASPIQNGHTPMIALSDLGWWVRYTLNTREKTSGCELQIASDWVSWDYLVQAFQEVTGKKAIFRRLSMDERFACMSGHNRPVASEKKLGDGSTTVRESFSGFWCLWRDDIIKRDFDWIRSTHPNTLSLADWMRQTNYTGIVGPYPLKNTEDGKGRIVHNKAVTSLL